MSSSTLRIISGGNIPTPSSAQAAAQTVARRVASPAAQAVREEMSFLSSQWGTALSDSQRQSFVTLGQIYSVSATKSTSSGKDVFVSMNFCRWQAGMDLLTDAPSSVDPVVKLGSYSLSASLTGGVLTLDAQSAGFAERVLVTALKPQSPGVMLLDKEKFKTLLVVSSIPSSGLSLGPAYQTAFSQVGAGLRVGVCLTPITPNGFYGYPVYRDTLVEDAP